MAPYVQAVSVLIAIDQERNVNWTSLKWVVEYIIVVEVVPFDIDAVQIFIEDFDCFIWIGQFIFVANYTQVRSTVKIDCHKNYVLEI